MNIRTTLAIPALTALLAFAPRAASAQAEDPAHDQLRQLRTDIIAAINAQDLEAMVQLAHPDVVITWQNNEVCRGHDGLREFFERMGKNAFKSYKVDPTPDDLTILHGGDLGISFGKSVGAYELFGREFEFHNRWTATLVLHEGRWVIGAYHVSLNALDNPILGAAKKSLYISGVGGVVIGLLAGILIGRRRGRNQ